MHIYNSVVGVQMWNILQFFTAFWFCVSVMRLNYLPQRIFKDNLWVRCLEKKPISLDMSVGLSEFINSAPNWRVSLKFEIEEFLKICQQNYKSCNYGNIIWGNLHEDISTFVFWTAVRTTLWLDNTVKWTICCVSMALNVAGMCIDINLFVNGRSC